jgi:hypothetical protein
MNFDAFCLNYAKGPPIYEFNLDLRLNFFCSLSSNTNAIVFNAFFVSEIYFKGITKGMSKFNKII